MPEIHRKRFRKFFAGKILVITRSIQPLRDDFAGTKRSNDISAAADGTCIGADAPASLPIPGDDLSYPASNGKDRILRPGGVVLYVQSTGAAGR